MQLVDAFDHKEDDESRQQKLYDDLNEITVCNDRCSCVLSCFEGRVAVAVSAISISVKLILPVMSVMTGMTMSLTSELTMLLKAPPMITPTAISITLPRMMKFLEFFYKYFHGFLL